MGTLLRLLRVGSGWGGCAAPIGGGVRRAGKEFAEEASKRMGRQGARQEARRQADEEFEIAWRVVGEEEMQLIAQTGKFVGTRAPDGTVRDFTRIATNFQRLWTWAIQGAPNPRLAYRYIIGIPVRSGTIGRALRLRLAGRDGPTPEFLWIDVDYINQHIIPNATLRLYRLPL